MSFDNFLLSKGWKRFRSDHLKGGGFSFTEDYSHYVSTYGPIDYVWKHPEFNFNIYWGLYIVGHHPKYFAMRRTGNIEDDYFTPTEEVYESLIKELNT